MKPTRQRFGKRAIGGSIAFAILAAACGGGSGTDSAEDADASTSTTSVAVTSTTSSDPTTTQPPTTEPPVSTTTSTEPVVEVVAVEVAGGLVTLDLPVSWEITSGPPESLEVTVEPLDPLVDRVYEFDLEQANRLIEFTNGTIVVGIATESRIYTAPHYRTWRNLVLAAAEDDGFIRNIELTLEWGGGRGDRIVGSVDGQFAQIDTVDVGGIKVVVVAFSESDPSDTDLDELREILATVEIDPVAIPLLTHVADARRFVTEEGTGSTPFTASYYVPGDWTLTDAEASRFEPPDGEGFIEIYLELDTEGFENHIQLELETFANEFLEVEPIRTEIDDTTVPVVVFWNGEPGQADAAVVMAADGVVFMNTYLSAEPALLVEIVDSLVFPESALG